MHLTAADIQTHCRKRGYDAPDVFCTQLVPYLTELTKWNSRMNLVGHGRWQEIMDDLVLDSFPLSAFLNSLPLTENPTCWDFGSGAGLPGIPLRMLWNAGTYTLVEARQKRALFMQTALALCQVQRTRVFLGRVEDFMSQTASADMVLSRAFMPWRDILELVHGRLASHGLVVMMTLEQAPEMPPGWTLEAAAQYMVPPLHGINGGPQRTRHLWAVSQTPGS